LFINFFLQILKDNEDQGESINQKYVQLNLKIVFIGTTENQSVAFAKQSVIYSNNYKLQAKTYLKRWGIERFTW